MWKESFGRKKKFLFGKDFLNYPSRIMSQIGQGKKKMALQIKMYSAYWTQEGSLPNYGSSPNHPGSSSHQLLSPDPQTWGGTSHPPG